MIYILCAQKNIVSRTIGNLLERQVMLPSNVKLWKTDTNVLDFPEPPKDTETLIVPSTHRSETGRPCLTVHTPGNWYGADMGGAPKTLCYTDNFMLKKILIFLNDVNNNTLGWDVTLEVDHHGPTYDIPITFAEIGSSEVQWQNKKALEILCNAVTYAVAFRPGAQNSTAQGVFGIGGPHYAPKFTHLELTQKDFLIGHILPSYHVDNIDYETFMQGIEKTIIKTKKIVLDWKGLKSVQRQKIINFCNKYGISYARG